MLSTIKNALSRFGYVATESTTRRKASSGVIKSEDRILKSKERKQLQSETHDLRRNFTTPSYTSGTPSQADNVKPSLVYSDGTLKPSISDGTNLKPNHNFAAKTSNTDFNRQLEAFIAKKSKAVDVTGRLNLRRYTRMLEASAVVDGDVWSVRRTNGKLQAIESDRVRDPERMNRGETWFHGVQVNNDGRPLKIAVWRRENGDWLTFDRTVDARKVYQHAYLDRFDQYRGVSPIACGVNELKDFREDLDYAAARDKINQLFALAIYREGNQGWNDTDSNSSESYEVDFGKGPILLDLDPGDKADFLTPKSPATESVELWRILLQVALKCLDIPYSFFAEDFTNFFGSRSALILYLKSCQDKRARVQEFLDDWTAWTINQGLISGELVLPEGMTEEDISYLWIPDGVAWWNPIQEVKADVMSVAAGFRTRGEIILERTGRDFRDVMDELADEQEYATDRGVTLTEAPPEIFNTMPPQDEFNEAA